MQTFSEILYWDIESIKVVIDAFVTELAVESLRLCVGYKASFDPGSFSFLVFC